MKLQKENQFNMIVTTLNYLLLYPFLESIAMFNTYIARLVVLIGLIQDLSKDKLLKKTGISSKKKQLHAELLTLATNLAGMLTVYAKENNETVLLEEINYTQTKLSKLSARRMADTARGIIQRATENKDNLVKYGITPEIIDKAAAIHSEFVNAIPGPRMTVSENKKTRLEINQYIKEAHSIIVAIDKIAAMYRLTEPSFLAGYKSARTLVDTRSGSYAVKGIVSDATTLQPLSGALLIFTHLNNGSTKTIRKRSSAVGSFKMRTMPSGKWALMVVKNGYCVKRDEVTIAESGVTELKVEMELDSVTA